MLSAEGTKHLANSVRPFVSLRVKVSNYIGNESPVN